MPPANFTGQQNALIFFQGKKGSGKTNAVKTETDGLSSVYFIDIRNEYDHVPKCTSVDDFIRKLMLYQNGRIKREMISRISFSLHSRKDYITLFELMKNFTNTTIVIDEADTLFQERKIEPLATDLMLGARNNCVNLMFCSKRPYLVPISVRSQIDIFFIFRTNEEQDVRYLEKKSKGGFPKQPEDLKQGECLKLVDGLDEIEVFQYPKYGSKKQNE